MPAPVTGTPGGVTRSLPLGAIVAAIIVFQAACWAGVVRPGVIAGAGAGAGVKFTMYEGRPTGVSYVEGGNVALKSTGAEVSGVNVNKSDISSSPSPRRRLRPPPRPRPERRVRPPQRSTRPLRSRPARRAK